jgi:hypothetical protein
MPRLRVHAAALLLAIVGGFAAARDASADSGPFAEFPGGWTGSGTIQLGNGAKERLRCRALYRVTSAAARDLELQLGCESDNYNFDFAGLFRAEEGNRISGRFSERTRNLGGTAVGRSRGDRIDLHAESVAFTADLSMLTRDRRQTVKITSRGGGETAEATITLRRTSR